MPAVRYLHAFGVNSLVAPMLRKIMDTGDTGCRARAAWACPDLIQMPVTNTQDMLTTHAQHTL